MRLTGPLTRRRREAIALAAREQISAATARMQRNAYRDHGQRMAAAIAHANAVYAEQGEGHLLHRALNEAMNVALMARDYDTLQTTTDPTIQGN
jgi:hypothetical protein